MNEKFSIQFLVHPPTKKDRILNWMKNHSKAIISFLLVTIMGILVFMYQTVWKYEWETNKRKIATIKLLYEEISINGYEAEQFFNSLSEIKSSFDSNNYIKLVDGNDQNISLLYEIPKKAKNLDIIKIIAPKINNEVLSVLREKGIILEMLNIQQIHFLYNLEKINMKHIIKNCIL